VLLERLRSRRNVKPMSIRCLEGASATAFSTPRLARTLLYVDLLSFDSLCVSGGGHFAKFVHRLGAPSGEESLDLGRRAWTLEGCPAASAAWGK
jgi:hypothetical protein